MPAGERWGMDRARPGIGSSPERLARLAAMEEGHFWFKGRRVLVDRLMRRFLGSRDA